MRKMGVIAAVICGVCLIIPLKGRGTSLGMAQRGPRLTAQDAISVARRNAQKPGSSFTVLREIVANADTRRIGDQALAEAQAHHIELFKNGILADFLRSGGFLVAEIEPRTNNMIALHLVSLGRDGVPEDVVYRCYPAAKLADAQELVKDTVEFTEALYSTPPSEATSLESRFHGGSFPGCGPSEECTLFAIPRSLLKLGADQSEVREVAALYGDLNILGFRYALSMPTFAASPLAATQAVGDKLETLKAEFLRKNRMNPDFHFDPQNIRSKEELLERIDVLRKLDKFVDEALKNEAIPALVKANISIATIPLQVGLGGPFNQNDKTQFGSAIAALLVIYWQRLPTGGFAVSFISEAG
jgi:hypothetical protein